MSSDDKQTITADLTDGQIEYAASEMPALDGEEPDWRWSIAMAREIKRRRTEEAKAKSMLAGGDLMTEVVKQVATARLLATMAPELRWYESDVHALFTKDLSATARQVYDRYVHAIALREAFDGAWKVHARSHRGVSTDTLLSAIREEAEAMEALADASREYARVVVPELRSIVEGKQRVFDAARKVEGKEP